MRTGIAVNLCVVQVVHDVLDLRDRSIPKHSSANMKVAWEIYLLPTSYVHLKVTTNEELTRHDCLLAGVTFATRRSSYPGIRCLLAADKGNVLRQTVLSKSVVVGGALAGKGQPEYDGSGAMT